MPPLVRIACAVVLGLTLMPQDAFARRYYPGGYGRYGWGGWGMGATDPAAGYMAGLGSFARGQGVYEVEDAQAQAINFGTMQKWNTEALSVGDLISFMQTYNLRFGPATTGRQLEIYRTLAGLLGSVLNDMSAAPAPATPPPPPPGLVDKGGKGLQNAAKNAFKDMNWPQLDAHARQP